MKEAKLCFLFHCYANMIHFNNIESKNVGSKNIEGEKEENKNVDRDCSRVLGVDVIGCKCKCASV
jgi:hypothetical protein